MQRALRSWIEQLHVGQLVLLWLLALVLTGGLQQHDQWASRVQYHWLEGEGWYEGGAVYRLGEAKRSFEAWERPWDRRLNDSSGYFRAKAAYDYWRDRSAGIISQGIQYAHVSRLAYWIGGGALQILMLGITWVWFGGRKGRVPRRV